MSIVSVSPVIDVVILVPPAIINVSLAADAVVVPVSPLTVSNKFCVVPPLPPVPCSSLAGDHLDVDATHLRT